MFLCISGFLCLSFFSPSVSQKHTLSLFLSLSSLFCVVSLDVCLRDSASLCLSFISPFSWICCGVCLCEFMPLIVFCPGSCSDCGSFVSPVLPTVHLCVHLSLRVCVCTSVICSPSIVLFFFSLLPTSQPLCSTALCEIQRDSSMEKSEIPWARPQALQTSECSL